MGEPKPGWKRHRFEEMVASMPRKARGWNPREVGVDRYVALEHLDSNCLKIRRWGSPEGVGANSDLRLFEPRDVILARRGIELRKVGVAEFRGVASGHALVFRAKPEAVLQEFLPFFMQSDAFMMRADRFSVGSLSRTVNLSALMREEFALPPHEEQLRIAQVLNLADDAAACQFAVLERARALEDAFLKDQFESKLHGIAPLVPLSNVATIQTGIAKGRMPDANARSVPYLSVANVQDGYLDLRDVGCLSVEVEKLERYLLQPNDVLMTEGGDLDKLGRGTVWEGQIQDCVHQNHVFAVRPCPGALDSWYLAALARSSLGRRYFLGCAKRTSNLASINKKQVGAMPVPLVAYDVQIFVAGQFRQLRAAVGEAENRCRKYEMLKGALLKDLIG